MGNLNPMFNLIMSFLTGLDPKFKKGIRYLVRMCNTLQADIPEILN